LPTGRRRRRKGWSGKKAEDRRAEIVVGTPPSATPADADAAYVFVVSDVYPAAQLEQYEVEYELPEAGQ